MANKKKPEEITEEEVTSVVTPEEITEEKPVQEPKKETKKVEDKKSGPKHAIGSIVFISKDADADLNGFKLFPQYKKYTYTVEAYDSKSDVYTLRRLNLSLKLKECDILAPEEKSGSALTRKQY